MINMGVSVKRANTLSSRMATVNARIGARVEAGLLAAGLALYDISQQIVPRDTEALADSARVRIEGSGLVVVTASDALVVYVGYGALGFSRTEFSTHEQRVVTRVPYDYAVYIHEADPYRNAPVSGQVDFLRGPCHTHAVEIREAFRRAL